MIWTSELDSRPVAPIPPEPLPAHRSGATRDLRERLAGVGALTFAAVVVLQNVIRGSEAPANDASARQVLDYFADHRGVTFVLMATFVVSGLGLAAFIGGSLRRFASGRRGWAMMGAVGATGIMVLFSVVVAVEEALAVAADQAHPNASAVEALWILHNSVFSGVLDLFIAVALFGLARAGVAAGVTPRAFAWLAPIGTALLLVAAAAGPAIAAGEMMALFGVGLVGFVIWLAFLAATGVRLVRVGNEA
jgi:hypothetical protein